MYSLFSSLIHTFSSTCWSHYLNRGSNTFSHWCRTVYLFNSISIYLINLGTFLIGAYIKIHILKGGSLFRSILLYLYFDTRNIYAFCASNLELTLFGVIYIISLHAFNIAGTGAEAGAGGICEYKASQSYIGRLCLKTNKTKKLKRGPLGKKTLTKVINS